MHPLGSSRTYPFFLFLHQYPQSPLMMVHPFMPPPSSTISNNGSSMPPPGGLTSTSEAPSNDAGSMMANPFHPSPHLRSIQVGSFAAQHGLLTDPSLAMDMHNNLGAGISPNYALAGTTGDPGALNGSLVAVDMTAMLQQATPPSDENQARRDQLLLQLLLEKHNDWESQNSAGGSHT